MYFSLAKDILTTRELLAVIEPEVIFQLSGYPVGAREVDHVLPSFRSNLLTAVNVFTAAAEIGCERVIQASSLEEPAQGAPQAIPSSSNAIAK